MPERTFRHDRRPVVVIGCDDIGSATACVLHRAGAAVVIVDSADPPWARRGMSYTDAWYVGGATLDGIDACFCGSVKSLPAILERGDMIAATTWSWEGVAAAPVAVIDTRTERATSALASPAALEGVLAIGVGKTRVGGRHADVVIPRAVAHPATAGPEGRGDRGTISTGCARTDAPHAGRFRTRHQIAERVEAGDVIGELGAFVVVAALAGVVTALAARGARIAAGDLLAEIDGHAEVMHCFGIAAEARAIAQRVAAAVRNAPRAGTARPAAASRERHAMPA